MVLVVNFFRIFEIKFICLIVALCDMVHDVEIFHLPVLLTATGNLF